MQRSTEKDWTTIGSVPPLGNSMNSLKNGYQFNDSTALETHASALYYRLQIINEDGTTRYSDIKTIDFNTEKQAINIYPNPTKEGIFIEGLSNNTGETTVELYNVQEQLLLKTSLVINSTATYLPLSINAQKAGIYFVHFIKEGKIETIKRFVVIP